MNIILKLAPIGSFSTISNTVLSHFEHLDIAITKSSFMDFIISMSNDLNQWHGAMCHKLKTKTGLSRVHWICLLAL